MKILVTGAAGFIGFHLARRLLAEGHQVHGIDNVNDYYDPRLKQARLTLLLHEPAFSFQRLDIAEPDRVLQAFRQGRFEAVVNLAAQAGVRHSLDNPLAYVHSNLLGFVNVLEGCARTHVPHLIFASSSSVYGANSKVPFSVEDQTDHPVSFYGATKKANELVAHSYSHLYGLPVTGLRFFTVYGPWGRPDMAYYKFVRAIDEGHPIDLYNHGEMRRDFTYIDDIVEGVVRVLDRRPAADADGAPHAIYNIGNHEAVELETFIATLAGILGRAAIKEYAPMQPGDVPATYAAIDRLSALTGFRPSTPLAQGLAKFVDWYRDYFKVAP